MRKKKLPTLTMNDISLAFQSPIQLSTFNEQKKLYTYITDPNEPMTYNDIINNTYINSKKSKNIFLKLYNIKNTFMDEYHKFTPKENLENQVLEKIINEFENWINYTLNIKFNDFKSNEIYKKFINSIDENLQLILKNYLKLSPSLCLGNTKQYHLNHTQQKILENLIKTNHPEYLSKQINNQKINFSEFSSRKNKEEFSQYIYQFHDQKNMKNKNENVFFSSHTNNIGF